MDRTEKEEWVASLHRTFNETGVVIVAHYLGLTVAEMGDLRGRLRDSGAHLKVTKNRLTVRALDGTRYADLAGLFKGPTAIAFSKDPVSVAKVVVGYAKTNPKLVLLGGGLAGQTLNAEGVSALATLPSLDELRGKLIGLINAPATRIAGVLQAPAGQLARVLAAYADKDKAEAA